eukprot:TRINITY_DN21630_c0_g1_i2.p1 TRINITY_DN21630_c0_g1~~TRINITY_DN21630_c0_g1_i2.p1  ORF type:complete len:397 (-),score=91.17 TRINITY_DN21630_c0_g1_i2:349-1539(-)
MAKRKRKSGDRKGGTSQTSIASEAKEDHKKPIYHISTLEPASEDNTQLFGTAGANRISVYELSSDGEISLLTMFVDNDAGEVYYCLAWGQPESPAQPSERGLYLAFAGLNGCLYVRHLADNVRCYRDDPMMCLIAHGGPINMIKVAPNNQNLILSASKDESIRMWSTYSGACVAVFAGGQGHTSEVLTIDLNADGTRLASAGMDNTVRVWDVDLEELKQIAESGHAALKGSYFKPKVIQAPAFVTDLSCYWAPNYIDCVQWVGELLLAKSVHEKVVMFDITKPPPRCTRESALVLQDYLLSNCNIWYLRFSVDPSFRYLAVGNMAGTVTVWDIDEAENPIAKLQYGSVGKKEQSNVTIRHCVFALHNKFVIASTDDGRIVVWKSGLELSNEHSNES